VVAFVAIVFGLGFLDSATELWLRLMAFRWRTQLHIAIFGDIIVLKRHGSAYGAWVLESSQYRLWTWILYAHCTVSQIFLGQHRRGGVSSELLVR
jgi:hypothetical protein